MHYNRRVSGVQFHYGFYYTRRWLEPVIEGGGEPARFAGLGMERFDGMRGEKKELDFFAQAHHHRG